MRIRLTIPGEPDEQTLGVALEAATRLAQDDVRARRVPDLREAIDAGVVWRPEPPGDESFDPPSLVWSRGWADCDDLAPWLAADMRESGYDPGASAIAMRSGPSTWHAVVRGSDGAIYDPSRWAGMPHHVVGQRAPCVRPLVAGRPAVAIGQSDVRVDVPGIMARRGCVIGASHSCSCEATDEDRIAALIDTIEHALMTAQRARTGDRRSLRALAAIYRVLRGDDPEDALAALRPQERVGVVPCLASLIPAVATAGTIAAVADALAAGLRELAGADSEFGRAMTALREGLGPVKIASAFATGINALAATGNIPIAAESAAARWYELLQDPRNAASPQAQALALRDAARLKDVANTISWVERALAGSGHIPVDLATRAAPEIIDLLRSGKYKEVVESVHKHVTKDMWPSEKKLLGDQVTRDVIQAIIASADPPPVPERPKMRSDFLRSVAETMQEMTEAKERAEDVFAPAFETALPSALPSLEEEIALEAAEAAEELRDDLRGELPSHVPPGWPVIFALGCSQLTEQCSS